MLYSALPNWSHHSEFSWPATEIKKLLKTQFFVQQYLVFLPSGPNPSLRILAMNNLSLYCSLNTRNSVWYPIKTTRTLKFLCVLITILVAATKEIGLEVNAHKTKYMAVSRYQNAGQIHSMKIDNSSIERVEELKYLGTTLTNQNSIQEEIKSRLKLGNACYYSVQSLLSSRLLSKNLKNQDM